MALRSDVRVAAAGSAVVGVAFGMGRFAFGLTLPDLRSDPGLAPEGLSDPLVGLIASATFAGYLVGIVGAPLLARRLGARAPTTLGGICGTVGGLIVVLAPGPAVLALGAVGVGSAAGWVWAPYSDLVGAVAAPARRPGLLAVVSTGTSAGLVLVGLVALVGPGWRVVWAAVGVASAAAAWLNLRWTPRPPAARHGVGPPIRRRALLVPAGYAVVYYAATTLFFTYAAESLRRAGLPSAAGPALYAVIGAVGLLGLLAGRWVSRWGAARAAGSCLALVAAGLAVLGLAGGSWSGALVAAAVFAPGYMAGAAVIAIWATALVPERATEAMTGVVAAGAVSAVVAPAVVGAVVGPLGLPTVLVGLAVLTAAAGLLLTRARGDAQTSKR